MTGSTPLLAAAVLLVLVLGLLLIVYGRGVRRSRGLGAGRTVSLDRVTLTSHRLGLVARPDRLLKIQGQYIPEEWKSSRTLRPWHKAQLGVALLLVEEQFGSRPPCGFVVTGDGKRHMVNNTEELRAWVLELAGQVRAARAAVSAEIPVSPTPSQCRPCGMRGHCRQARE
jgi:CRISPR-associated exonuclease Cas4